MSKELRDELLEMRSKANISPKTDYRFLKLESYLSALNRVTSSLNHLTTYSKEDINNIVGQLNDLSDQDREALLFRIGRGSNPNFFNLSDEEMEKLRMARKELSFHERAHLFSDLILTASGTALLDLGEVFEAEIEIDDNSSPARETRPYAHIYFSDHYRRRIETFDILESIKNNPTTIGHPAIVFAIHHWQRVIYTKRVLERDDVTSHEEWGQIVKEMFDGGRDVKIAERNLKAISKFLYDSAKKRAIPKESALALKMDSIGLGLKDTNTILYKAWERLGSEHIDPLDEVSEILAKIEADLDKFEKQPHTNMNSRRISTGRVMEFLRQKGNKGGRKFVGNKRNGESRRQGWKIFRNAFAAWFFNLSQGVVQDYLEKAAKQNVIVDEVYEPNWSATRGMMIRIFLNLLRTQLTAVREPIVLREDDVGSYGIEKSIKMVFPDTGEEE